MLLKKSVLEEVGGYDQELAYGEDTDLVLRLRERGLDQVNCDAKEYHTLVSNLSEVFRQGRWYGKSMMRFFAKHPGESLSLFSIMLFFFLPISSMLAAFSRAWLYMALIQHLIVFVYVVSAAVNTGSMYAFLVPIVKIVRSYAEAIGIIEGLFTNDFGRD